eukprot:snap_masked-scaffold43_size480169-processed-gene-0.4 protein:Tk12715 transcript:snap_masked-scaffold43_size480169-processed-gene-0.4-mRNA-1 annotation:"enhancer of split mgamma"
MPLEHSQVSSFMDDETPMSRTHQYRKITKPLLERKRRARINKCLDELKDLMMFALQAEGESITKLEKADVLEMTVQHLQKLKRQQMLRANPAVNVDRFRSGYTSCANEVSKFLAVYPGVDVSLGTSIMSSLGSAMNAMDIPSLPLTVKTSPSSPIKALVSPNSDGGYTSGREETLSPISVGSPSPKPTEAMATNQREPL